jgi:ubiquinone/menaquinone biosynthesis C-methylase UbiE
MANTEKPDVLEEFFKDAATARHLLKHEHLMSKPAKLMLSEMGFDGNDTASFKLLDHACGVGMVAKQLHELVSRDIIKKSSILCADFSESMVDMCKQRGPLEGWVNTEAVVMDAQVCVRLLFTEQSSFRLL